MAYSLAMNHAYIDGNKRIGHAAMETLLVLNGMEIAATVDEQEQVFLDLAAGNLSREALIAWITAHAQPLDD